jgi:hypothetical protein
MGNLVLVSGNPAPFQPDMSNLNQIPPILALPLELREFIYKEVLSNSSQGPQLLRACREIYADAHKFLFQRRINFRGQTALHHWLDQVPVIRLHHITDITLELRDVNLTPLLSPASGAATAPSTPRLLAWEIHEHELDRLNEALGKFQNIKTLTIRALPERQSFLYREFLAKVLESLGSLYPRLSSLALEGNFHYQSLSFLSSLEELESLSFDGFSSTSPSETAAILSNLTHLTNLSLISQHVLLTPTTHIHSNFTSKSQSLTTPVLLAMKRLASLSVTETMHPATRPLFFTPEVLTSLRDHSTLSSFSVRLSHVPSNEALAAFEYFLNSAPGIERLELDWPGLEPAILETYTLLSERVKDFWVRCEGIEIAFDILYTVLEDIEEGGLQGLKRIVLVKKDWEKGRGAAVVMAEEEEDEEGEGEKDEGQNGADPNDEDEVVDDEIEEGTDQTPDTDIYVSCSLFKFHPVHRQRSLALFTPSIAQSYAQSYRITHSTSIPSTTYLALILEILLTNNIRTLPMMTQTR